MAPRTALSANGAHASVRYLKVSPYKVRQVLTLIRGLPVDDARRALQLCPKDAADPVGKVLDAAVANAEHNRQLDAEELFVARAWADDEDPKWAAARVQYASVQDSQAIVEGIEPYLTQHQATADHVYRTWLGPTIWSRNL